MAEKELIEIDFRYNLSSSGRSWKYRRVRVPKGIKIECILDVIGAESLELFDNDLREPVKSWGSALKEGTIEETTIGAFSYHINTNDIEKNEEFMRDLNLERNLFLWNKYKK